ncbi:MAG TPA: hypothetical protein PK156_13980 [Polyangium sp.]|nr:hypothetical protein [Polyangium sp.]
MSTNEKANLKLDKKTNDEAIVEVSPAEANAVAGGTREILPSPDFPPNEADPGPL